MSGLNTTELAAHLGLSKARISQYISEGKLAGCYSGDGRNRRFDVGKVADALGRTLHPGQMMGNGAATRAVLRDMKASAAAPAPAQRPRADTEPVNDSDRYEMARILKAEEEARRLRRQNMVEEGTWVLAVEVQRHTARLMSQEVAQVETMIRDAARAVADAFGIDFRSVRKVMMDQWRQHRADRSRSAGEVAEAVPLAEGEKEADI